MVDLMHDQMPRIRPSISDAIGDRITDLRKRAGMSRAELAEAAQAAGAPASLTAVSLGFLENGRRDKDGRRQRHFALDELFALAAALELSPVELLGDQAGLFVGEASPVSCPTCEGAPREPGQLQRRVRADVADLADLHDLEPSLAQTAYVLAAAIDAGGGEDGRQLPALTKEFRATLEQIAAGRRGREDPDEGDEFDDLDSPEVDEPDVNDADVEGPDLDGPD